MVLLPNKDTLSRTIQNEKNRNLHKEPENINELNIDAYSWFTAILPEDNQQSPQFLLFDNHN